MPSSRTALDRGMARDVQVRLRGRFSDNSSRFQIIIHPLASFIWLGFLVLTMSLVSYFSGIAVDYAVSVRTVSIVTGLMALIPAALWGLTAMPLWKGEAETTPQGPK